MANSEDVVWMACESHLRRFGHVANCAPCLAVTLDYVRAEVRELRKDKARLDWLCEQTGEGLLLHATRGGYEVEWSGYGLGTLGGTRTLRAAIDDAMGGEG